MRYIFEVDHDHIQLAVIFFFLKGIIIIIPISVSLHQWRLFIKMATDWQVSEVGDTCRPAAGPRSRQSVQIEWISAGTAHLGFPALWSVPHLLSLEINMNRCHFYWFSWTQFLVQVNQEPIRMIKIADSQTQRVNVDGVDEKCAKEQRHWEDSVWLEHVEVIVCRHDIVVCRYAVAAHYVLGGVLDGRKPIVELLHHLLLDVGLFVRDVRCLGDVCYQIVKNGVFHLAFFHVHEQLVLWRDRVEAKKKVVMILQTKLTQRISSSQGGILRSRAL